MYSSRKTDGGQTLDIAWTQMREFQAAVLKHPILITNIDCRHEEQHLPFVHLNMRGGQRADSKDSILVCVWKGIKSVRTAAQCSLLIADRVYRTQGDSC